MSSGVGKDGTLMCTIQDLRNELISLFSLLQWAKATQTPPRIHKSFLTAHTYQVNKDRGEYLNLATTYPWLAIGYPVFKPTRASRAGGRNHGQSYASGFRGGGGGYSAPPSVSQIRSPKSQVPQSPTTHRDDDILLSTIGPFLILHEIQISMHSS